MFQDVQVDGLQQRRVLKRHVAKYAAQRLPACARACAERVSDAERSASGHEPCWDIGTVADVTTVRRAKNGIGDAGPAANAVGTGRHDHQNRNPPVRFGAKLRAHRHGHLRTLRLRGRISPPRRRLGSEPAQARQAKTPRRSKRPRGARPQHRTLSPPRRDPLRTICSRRRSIRSYPGAGNRRRRKTVGARNLVEVCGEKRELC